MDSCTMRKIMFAAGGGLVAGAGGYLAKNATWGAVGAGVGGVLGWLLSPACDIAAPGTPALPGGQALPGILPSTSVAQPSLWSSLLTPMTPTKTYATSTALLPSCPSGKYYEPKIKGCMDYVK